MRKCLLLVGLLLFGLSAFAQESDDFVSPRFEGAKAWFVELSSPPTSDGSALTTVRAEKAAFRKAAKAAGITFKERRSFDVLFNGFSIEVAPSQLGRLRALPGVKNVWPVIEITPSYDVPSNPDMATAVAMTGADIARTQLGYDGTGIKVGIIDSGIDYHNADLGNGTRSRVVYGYDFVGDEYDAQAAVPVIKPDNDPDDCHDPTASTRGGIRFSGGHGTHVAGIVGANGLIKGVAPGVTFGAYRVFGCIGSTDSDIMVAAMEMALADGMDVVNMSIGAAYQWPQYPTAEAANRLVKQGVVVVTSIGNSGANGLYSAGAPGVGSKVIGVAAVDNTHVNTRYFMVSPDSRKVMFNPSNGAPSLPLFGTEQIVATGTPTSTADGCAPFAPGTLAGQVALIRRGSCSFWQKARNAELAGARAVVIYNNAPGMVYAYAGPPAPYTDPPVTIPVVGISDVDGATIYSRTAGGAVNITYTADVVSAPAPSNGGLTSSFSSFGLAFDLSFKPDITAPGGNILSTYPTTFGSYAVLGGTSMASPHVAGAAALLLQARPNTPPAAVKTIFQNTARPILWWGNPGLGLLDNVHRQGAGLLDVDAAILSTTKIEPGSLPLGESENGPAVRTLTITNKGTADVTYDVTHVPTISTGPNTFTPTYHTGFASLQFSTSALTVPAGGTASLTVTITANPALPERGIYGGYIVFTPQGGGEVYRVPYAGLKGDYQSMVVLQPTACGLPSIFKIGGSTACTTGALAGYTKQAAGATFTLTGTDYPVILYHFDHGIRMYTLELYSPTTGKSWHLIGREDWVGRNSTAAAFFGWIWDGWTTNGSKWMQVPNGEYVVKLTLLKANGDASNPAHWETWTSPSITIARPPQP